MKISVIIPTYNEADNIVRLIQHLKSTSSNSLAEIIVADGGSNDDTMSLAAKQEVVTLSSPIKGRAGQMNFGMQKATGDILYFVHADSLPPISYQDDIIQAVKEGYNCGSFRTLFDSNMFLLKINAFFTRFNYLFFRGGDQSIFVTKDLTDEVGNYKEDMLIMEDYDFLSRLWAIGRFKLIPKGTLVSARKYEDNSWLRVQLANYNVVKMYRNGATQQDMIDTYKRMLNYRQNSFDTK